MSRQHVLGLACVLLTMLASTPAWPSDFVTLRIGPHEINVELALTVSEQTQGLMYRTQLDENDGMLFVYKTLQEVCMWMKNTVIPLEVAFIDRHGKIIKLAQMKPLRKKTHCAEAPAHYALEMNADWFSSRNIEPGDQVLDLPLLEEAN